MGLGGDGMTELEKEKALKKTLNLIYEILCNLSKRINELDPEELKEMVDKMTAAEVKGINDGWIPVEERLPESESYVLLSFANLAFR